MKQKYENKTRPHFLVWKYQIKSGGEQRHANGHSGKNKDTRFTWGRFSERLITKPGQTCSRFFVSNRKEKKTFLCAFFLNRRGKSFNHFRLKTKAKKVGHLTSNFPVSFFFFFPNHSLLSLKFKILSQITTFFISAHVRYKVSLLIYFFCVCNFHSFNVVLHLLASIKKNPVTRRELKEPDVLFVPSPIRNGF